MKKIFILFIAYLIYISSAVAETGQFDFDRWNNILNQIQDRAVAENIDDRIINDTIQDASFIPKIVWRDKNQSEFKLTMNGYLSRMINKNRINTGKEMRKKYPTLLNRVYNKYGIQPYVILAFWGLESNYGQYKAHYQLSDAFLTLIYEGRREQFFTEQLIALMKIADKNKLDIKDVYGSWAGAMGHFQFMPSTLASYGADGNKDGKIDIIHSIGDAMASAGNYLHKMGWNPEEKIILEVTLPENFDTNLCDGKIKKPLYQWSELGVLYAPDSNIIAGLLCDPLDIPSEADAVAHKAYLTYPNFYVIKRWNNSNSYAMAVALLSEKLK